MFQRNLNHLNNHLTNVFLALHKRKLLFLNKAPVRIDCDLQIRPTRKLWITCDPVRWRLMLSLDNKAIVIIKRFEDNTIVTMITLITS